MRTHHTAWRQCPYCGHVHDAATNVRGNGAPEAGDASICIQCAGISTFDPYAFGGLREPTAAELAEYVLDPRVQLAQRAVRMIDADE